MDEKTRQLTDAASNFADTGRDYVRSSPATSVLVAARRRLPAVENPGQPALSYQPVVPVMIPVG